MDTLSMRRFRMLMASVLVVSSWSLVAIHIPSSWLGGNARFVGPYRHRHVLRALAPKSGDEAAPQRRVAIVTGGSGGIGLACAHRLAAAGHDLVIGYGHDAELAKTGCDELVEKHGCKAVAVGGDLTTEEGRVSTIAAIFEAVDGFSSQTSHFVHAAGFFAEGLSSRHFDGGLGPDGCDFAMYDQYQSIYPKAFTAICEGTIKRMGDFKGRIVAISNPGCNCMQTPRLGYDMPGQGKAAMEQIVRYYAVRCAERGICVNSVSPAYTDTKEWNKIRLLMGKGDLEKGRELLDQRMLSRAPIKRWAQPDEIAAAVEFLTVGNTGLITGVNLPVDGGLHWV